VHDDSLGDAQGDSLDDVFDVPPTSLRIAVIVILAQALALVALALIVVIKTAIGHPHSLAGALLSGLMAILGAGVLALCARGVFYLRAAARSPIIIIELLALPVGYSLTFQAHLPGYGAPILVSALVVLYLLFTPTSREALTR
jgi:hypothetical protein